MWPFFIDYWYIVLVVPVMIASLIIQGIMRSTYKKYSNVYAGAGITGAEMAQRVLRDSYWNSRTRWSKVKEQRTQYCSHLRQILP